MITCNDAIVMMSLLLVMMSLLLLLMSLLLVMMSCFQSHHSKVTHLNDQLDTATLDVREGQTTLAGVSWEIVTGRKYRNLVGIVQHVQQILWCVLKPEKAHKDTSA